MKSKYKFVLWGLGKRGKRFLRGCPHKNICAIIDGNVQLQGNTYEGISVISFEEYLENYSNVDILIAVDDNVAIQETLEREGIHTFFLLEDTPHEILGYSGSCWLEELPIKIEANKDYIIYGLNFYSILLREFLFEKYGKVVDIIIESDGPRNVYFKEKYLYVKDIAALEQLDDVEILWASRFQNEKKLARGVIQDVFDFMNQITFYHNPELKKYHNTARTDTCIIVATGPSLRMEDLTRIHEAGIPSFGVNKTYLAFEETMWRPNYLVVMDDKMMLSYGKEMLKTEVAIKFFSDVADMEEQPETYGDINRLHDHVLEYYPYEPKFSTDICKGVYSGRTVVYTCIQIAIYMGYKKIYIIGADHNYSCNQSDLQNHFHKDYYKGDIRPDNYFKEKAELAYLRARRFAEENSVQIYNATRGGRLEVFERADLDELLNNHIEKVREEI